MSNKLASLYCWHICCTHRVTNSFQTIHPDVSSHHGTQYNLLGIWLIDETKWSNIAIVSKGAKTLVCNYIKHRSDTFASNQCLIDLDPIACAFCIMDERWVTFEVQHHGSMWWLVVIRYIRNGYIWCPDVMMPKWASRWHEKSDATLQVRQELSMIIMTNDSRIYQYWDGGTKRTCTCIFAHDLRMTEHFLPPLYHFNNWHMSP